MSSIAANGGTVRQGDEKGRSQLTLRLVSALVLAPVFLLGIYLGSLWFAVLIGVAVAVMAWEWARLCHGGTFAPDGIVVPAATLGALAAAAAGYFEAAAAVALAGALLAWTLAAALRKPLSFWAGTGTLLIALAGVALLWLREGAASGALLTVWFFGAIWLTDIAAYFTGRAFGGPKLAPAISPNKTWAGLIGGVTASAAFSAAWPGWLAGQGVWSMAAAGALLAVLAQLGDLMVSRVKRLARVKDTGRLIPGHGGLLDRADGFLLAGALVAVGMLAGWENALPWQ